MTAEVPDLLIVILLKQSGSVCVFDSVCSAVEVALSGRDCPMLTTNEIILSRAAVHLSHVLSMEPDVQGFIIEILSDGKAVGVGDKGRSNVAISEQQLPTPLILMSFVTVLGTSRKFLASCWRCVYLQVIQKLNMASFAHRHPNI